MKVKYQENVYCFPDYNKINFLINNEHRNDFITCLSEYFGKKKKSYCQVFSDDGQRIMYDEMEFLYLPFLNTNMDNNFNLIAKSLFNTEIAGFIAENPEKFQSIDSIRERIHELITDTGVYTLSKILSNHIDTNIEFYVTDFNLNKIIEMLSICQDNLSIETKFMIAYNLLLYLYRDKNCIVYIDFPITNTVLNWIKSNENANIWFLIENNIIASDYGFLNNCSLVNLSNQDFMEHFEFDTQEFKLLSYVFHPFVQHNIELQSKKIFDYYSQFNDNSTTFYLTFSRSNSQIIDK